MSLSLSQIFTYPYQNDILLRKQKSIKRQLLARENIGYTPVKIAFLGGSTVDDIKNVFELFLLESSIKPTFYQSEYNKFYEDAVFGNAELDAFAPEVIIVFTSSVNIINLPYIIDDKAATDAKIKAEMLRFTDVWEKLAAKYNAVVIQNNFDLPSASYLGSLSAVLPAGINRFVAALNEEFAAYAENHDNFYLHDFTDCQLK